MTFTGRKSRKGSKVDTLSHLLVCLFRRRHPGDADSGMTRPDYANAQYFTDITLGTPPQSVSEDSNFTLKHLN